MNNKGPDHGDECPNHQRNAESVVLIPVEEKTEKQRPHDSPRRSLLLAKRRNSIKTRRRKSFYPKTTTTANTRTIPGKNTYQPSWRRPTRIKTRTIEEGKREDVFHDDGDEDDFPPAPPSAWQRSIGNTAGIDSGEDGNHFPRNNHPGYMNRFLLGVPGQQTRRGEEEEKVEEAHAGVGQRNNNNDDEELSVFSAFCVPTREEQRQSRIARLLERIQNAPLVEARLIVSDTSTTASERRRQSLWTRMKRKISSMNRREIYSLIIAVVGTLLLLGLIIALVLVGHFVNSRREREQRANNNNIGVNENSSTSDGSLFSSPSFSPSNSLMPSFSPSTTHSPTSQAFQQVVELLGLNYNNENENDEIENNDHDENVLSLWVLPFWDPNHYIYRTVDWMAHTDQVTATNFLMMRSDQQVQEDLFVKATDIVAKDATLLDAESSSTNMQQQQQLRNQALQRFAMASLYFATDGDSSWKEQLNFSNPMEHECNWKVSGRKGQNLESPGNIHCINDTVVGIALHENKLGGSLPDTLALLSNLTHLELRNNLIKGTLPSTLSLLSQLEVLDLDNNQFSGTFPTELTTLPNLRELWLRFNELTGSIPQSIGNLTSIQQLDVAVNFMTGSLPTTLEYLTGLHRLHLGYNMFTSQLLSELNHLPDMVQYEVADNFLTGTLPFQNGSNPSLVSFLAANNNFHGDLTSLTHLTQLWYAFVGSNNFTGTIPSELCRLPLSQFRGQENQLTGSIPSCFGDFDNLVVLHLASNNLVGPLPDLPFFLHFLYIYNNSLTGEIPTTREKPPKHDDDEEEDDHHNQTFPHMTVFDIARNNFTSSTFPTQVFEWKDLTRLDMADVNIRGTLPPEIGNMTQIKSLEVNYNSELTGTIPSEVGLLTELTSFRLDWNNLRGTIPAEVGELTKLHFLRLSGNDLTGTVPASFGNLTSLQVLALQANDFEKHSIAPLCSAKPYIEIFTAYCNQFIDCTCCTACCDRHTLDGFCVPFEDVF